MKLGHAQIFQNYLVFRISIENADYITFMKRQESDQNYSDG